MLRYKKIALTTGDPDGIGFEIVCKALSLIGPQADTIFFIYRDHKQSKKQSRYFKILDEHFLRLTFNNQIAALGFVESLVKKNAVPKNILIDLALKRFCCPLGS